MFGTGHHQTISGDQVPLFLLVGAGLAGDDDVFAVVSDRFARESVRRWRSVRIVWVFPVQSGTSGRGVVSADKC